MENRALAAYPFLREAAEFVKKKGPSLEELLGDLAYSEYRGAGVERVKFSSEAGSIPAPTCRTDRECLGELLSYLCARLVVSVAASPHLVRRYALSEAKRAGKLLETEETDTVVAIAEELELPVRASENVFSVHFTDYLKHTAQLKATEWKLINRRVVSGGVEITKEEFGRVLQEAIRKRFEGELPLPVPDSVKDAFDEPARALKTELEARLQQFQVREIGKVRTECFPPCIRQLLAMAQAGENVPHSGRFALVTFLHTIGMTVDEIMALFAISPDFREDKTRYQVEHITGVTSGTEYSPPGCDTMKTYGICFNPDSLCRREWLTHPLKYYKAKTKTQKGTGSMGVRASGTQQAQGAPRSGEKGPPADGTSDESPPPA